MVFFENIVHRVSGGKPQKTILRKFVGFRISDDPEQWCPENAERMECQAALRHKGGDLAPMYPNLWLTNWPDKCEEFSQRLKPVMLTTHTYKTGKKRGRTITLPKREPPSLQELGRMYEMTERARKRFKPHTVY